MALQKKGINFSDKNLEIPSNCTRIKVLISTGKDGQEILKKHEENFLNENPTLKIENELNFLIKLEKYIDEKGLIKRALEEKNKSNT